MMRQKELQYKYCEMVEFSISCEFAFGPSAQPSGNVSKLIFKHGARHCSACTDHLLFVCEIQIFVLATSWFATFEAIISIWKFR